MSETSLKGFESFHKLFELSVTDDGLLTVVSTTKTLPHFTANQVEVFSHFLSITNSVHELFKLPHSNLKSIKLNTPFPLSQFFQHSLYALNLYSSVPSFFCVFTIENERFIVHILHKPALSGSENNPIVYFEESENISAFNIPFFSLFKDIFDSPINLFSKNLTTTMIETPKQITNRLFMDFNNYTNSVKETDLIASDNLSIDASTNEIQNNSSSTMLVSSRREINYDEFKTTLLIRYRSPLSIPPVLLFGANTNAPITGYSPDYAGFSIGPDPDGTHILLKKSGWVLLSSQYTNISASEHYIEVTLHKKSVLYKLDGAIILQHDLFETHWPLSCFFHISIRPGSNLKLISCIQREENRSTDQSQEKPLLQFRHLPNRFFTVAYIPRMFLSSNTVGIRGIELHEVTSLQNEIISNRKSILSLKRSRESTNKEAHFIGESPVIRKMINQTLPIARSEITVLLSGSTGAGKEVLARYIHANSQRYDKPFVKLDCSTIPDSLFESIVFGHVKGSFTGATHSTTGIIESADQGTVFIDEIQNLSLNSQAKLLRILEDRIIYKIGSNQAVNVNVRFIVGTNQNLEKRIKEGFFREDLYYRINLAIIFLPPLCERRDDIAELCIHFIRQYNNEMTVRVGTLSMECISILQKYSWPGNVRELKNVIYHACIFAVNNEITTDIISQILSSKMVESQNTAHVDSSKFTTAGKQYRDILDKHNGNAVKAAKELKISRNSLYYNLRKYGIDPKAFRC